MKTNCTGATGDAPHTAFLSMGSNLGDRLSFLQGGLRYLENRREIVIRAVSSVYETDPVGYAEQPAFLNIVVEVGTTLSPHGLLAVCQKAENRFQRKREVRWGPRTLDIDLLTYDQITCDDADLILPHPRMGERAFVQIPLHELQTGEKGSAEGVRLLHTGWYKPLQTAEHKTGEIL